MPEDEKQDEHRDSFKSFTKRLRANREESEQERNARAARMEMYRRMSRR